MLSFHSIPSLGGRDEMTDTIEQLDPFMPLYVQKKMEDPNNRFVLRQFRSDDVMFFDKMIQLTQGKTKVVTTQDWDNLREVVTYFAKRWPEEFSEFRKTMEDIRHSRNTGGYSKSREIKYVGALPPRLERIIKKLYIEQEMDKKFMNLLVKKMPVFKVGGENN